MTENASQFIGDIPQIYDRCLGPNLFTDYAEDTARRAAATGATEVLELAAGTGIVSRRLHDALAPETRLVVTDLNAPMLEIARAKFEDGAAVAFGPADAMNLPFEDDSFDLMVCQFGVMFFPDKVAAFREAARVLRPGGCYLFNAWGSLTRNPYSQVANEIAERLFPDDPPGFYKVPFSYCDPEAVRADMRAAGWRDIDHETVGFDKRIEDGAGFAHGLVFGNPMIDEIKARGGASPEDVVDAIREGLIKRFGPEPYTMPLQAAVFTARI